jgi:thioesterase domain-containing protein
MAQRLRDAGRRIASLTIVDAEVPDPEPDHIREYDSREAFLKLVAVCELAAECSIEIGAEEVDSRDQTARLALLHERLVRFGLMPKRSRAESLRGLFRSFSSCVRTTFHPTEIYPDPVHLVLLRDPNVDEPENVRQFAITTGGWKRWASNLTASIGSGNHVTGLKLPHAHTLAGCMFR